MSSEDSIEFVDVHPRIVEALRNGNCVIARDYLSALDSSPLLIVARIRRMSRVLELSLHDLCATTKLSVSDALQLVRFISIHYLKTEQPFIKAVDTLADEKKSGPLSMGCSVLDSWLRGGLLVSSLTEIAGISSAGKTQICLQLALTVQLPRNIGGLDGQAVYICTEDAFPNRRLYQLAEMFCRNHLDLGHSSKFYTDRIFVTHCSTAAALEGILDHKVPNMVAQYNVRLIVVDSIAALFRSDYDADQIYTRSKLLLSIGMKLKTLAHRYKAVVVIVNQVTGTLSLPFQDTSSIKPSLGETWACQINTRLMVNRTDQLQVS
jgi:DNA-repair protein XRCC3